VNVALVVTDEPMSPSSGIPIVAETVADTPMLAAALGKK
jgi:hypothetical protein